MSEHAFQSVTELTASIKLLLEDTFFDVKVEGEISNLKPASSGHFYFTVKDAGAQLPAVMWRSVAQRYRTLMEDGLQVQVFGEIQLYVPHGRYQLIVNHLQPAGRGALQEAFERLKLKLQQEGLFNELFKKPLPSIPRKIGVVTASTSAAFQDIRQTIENRFPLTEIVLYPSAVQGDTAANQIVSGIQYLDQRDDVDVILIGRGGGSLEDLWPFNEEIVARAIYACQTPLVSAVGHEIDFTISDFCADARAATPTQAAVMLTPDQNDVRAYLDEQMRILQRPIEHRIQIMGEKMAYFESKMNKRYLLSLFEKYEQYLEQQHKWMHQQLAHKMQGKAQDLKNLETTLKSLNPNLPLEQGYVRVMQEDQWVKRKAHLNQDRPYELIWSDGVIK